jgi:hypothetical protein
MTRKLSITTVVAVAALSVGVPAAFGGVHAGGEAAPVLAQPDPMIEDGFAQAVAQVSTTGYRDAHERGIVGVASESPWLKALDARSGYGFGVSATTPVYRDSFERTDLPQGSALAAYSDSFERTDLPRGTVPVSVTTSGNDIQWPQIGVGLGMGLLLALGLGLIMRTVNVRPFAH